MLTDPTKDWSWQGRKRVGPRVPHGVVLQLTKLRPGSHYPILPSPLSSSPASPTFPVFSHLPTPRFFSVFIAWSSPTSGKERRLQRDFKGLRCQSPQPDPTSWDSSPEVSNSHTLPALGSVAPSSSPLFPLQFSACTHRFPPSLVGRGGPRACTPHFSVLPTLLHQPPKGRNPLPRKL